MSAQPFTVHVDPDALLRPQLATAVPVTPVLREPGGDATAAAHHGARDERLAARKRSERERSRRAAGAGSGRSYAFRRS